VNSLGFHQCLSSAHYLRPITDNGSCRKMSLLILFGMRKSCCYSPAKREAVYRHTLYVSMSIDGRSFPNSQLVTVSLCDSAVLYPPAVYIYIYTMHRLQLLLSLSLFLYWGGKWLIGSTCVDPCAFAGLGHAGDSVTNRYSKKKGINTTIGKSCVRWTTRAQLDPLSRSFLVAISWIYSDSADWKENVSFISAETTCQQHQFVQLRSSINRKVYKAHLTIITWLAYVYTYIYI